MRRPVKRARATPSAAARFTAAAGRARWTAAHIAAERATIKAALDATQKRDGVAARLRAALDGVGALEEDATSDGRLKRHLFAVSALVHHQRHGGLSERQVRQILALARSILLVEGVGAGSSPASQLHADLALLASQIHGRDGDFWRAAWEGYLVTHLTSQVPSGGAAFHALSRAVRAMRLGHARAALVDLERADSEEMPAAQRERARLERVKALRLAGDFVQSEALALQVAAMPLSAPARLELGWEELCREAQASGDLGKMARVVGYKGTHFGAAYVLEASLWTKAVRRRDWLSGALPSIRNVAATTKFDLKKRAQVYRAALQLDTCYDVGIPLPVRLEGLTDAVAEARRLPHVEQELLFWLAVARWLARRKIFGMATLALGEYAGLSQRLSSGRTADVLGLAADLLERAWYAGDGGAKTSPAPSDEGHRDVETSDSAEGDDESSSAA